jgi:hypothetical protein
MNNVYMNRPHEIANFVGLALKHDRFVVREGIECSFSDPALQCPYHDLAFPSSTRASAVAVVAAFQGAFGNNQAAQVLVWALGAHLKAFLGYWPHLSLQAEKGIGKTSIVRQIGRATGMRSFSRQALQTEFRMASSMSFTSYPVAWDETSANMEKALPVLHDGYRFAASRWGFDMTELLVCAPVMLVGEEVDATTLQCRLVKSVLKREDRGPQIASNLPVFPMRQWLDFLAEITPGRIRGLMGDSVKALSTSAAKCDGARSTLKNYAACRTTWVLLCEFTDIPVNQGDFMGDLEKQMCAHMVQQNPAAEGASNPECCQLNGVNK